MRFIKNALAALVLLLGFVAPAPATILFAGGEDIDFTSIGSVTVSTTAGTFRSGYARAAMQFFGSTPGALDPAPNRILTQAVTAQTSLWMHAYLVQTTAVSTTSNVQIMCAYSPDGVVRLCFRGTGSVGQVKLTKYDSSRTATDLVTCTLGGWPVFSAKTDWFINYAVSGHSTLYANGVNVCDYAGDVTTNSTTTLNQFYFGEAVSAQTTNWSEVIISTTDTRDMNLFTCYPNANGTTMAWSGAYTNVNPATINDTSSITTGSNNLVAEFTCPSIPSGAFTVPAVASAARLQIGGTGPQNFQFVTRPGTGSTDYFSGSVAGTVVFSNNFQIQATNPATSASWSLTDITGFQQGLKSIP